MQLSNRGNAHDCSMNVKIALRPSYDKKGLSMHRCPGCTIRIKNS